MRKIPGLNERVNDEPISGCSSDRSFSHGLDAENCEAQLRDDADAAAIEADEHTLGNEECADGCSMILESGHNLTIIFDVDGCISISTWVAKFRESVDGRDDDACKVSAASKAVSNSTDECKWRENASEAEEHAEDGVN